MKTVHACLQTPVCRKKGGLTSEHTHIYTYIYTYLCTYIHIYMDLFLAIESTYTYT